MSAFIVDQKTMQNVIAGVDRIVKDSPGFWLPKITGRSYGHCFDPKEERATVDWQELGNRFYELNRDAVFQRYEGRHESGEPAEKYDHQRSLCTAIQSFKAMKCLRYQCSEGDCDTKPDYLLLESLIGSLAEKIITGLPEYDRADWG